MKYVLILLVCSVTLACGGTFLATPTPQQSHQEVTPVTPEVTLTQVPTVTAAPITKTATATRPVLAVTVVKPIVSVREKPGGKVIGYVEAGQSVNVLECTDEYCKIEQPFGYVWRGCLSDNPDGLGCEAR
jgi:hypothetical protein